MKSWLENELELFLDDIKNGIFCRNSVFTSSGSDHCIEFYANKINMHSYEFNIQINKEDIFDCISEYSSKYLDVFGDMINLGRIFREEDELYRDRLQDKTISIFIFILDSFENSFPAGFVVCYGFTDDPSTLVSGVDAAYHTSPEASNSISCECGATKVGSTRHSDWCPLYKIEG